MALSGIPLERKKKAKSGSRHPTGARVLGGSIEAGSFEHLFFVKPSKGETDRALSAARRLLDNGRRLKREERAGTRALTAYERLLTALTASFVRVYEELATLARLNAGKVYPSYEHLAEATGLGRATVARALKLLEQLGLLIRQRRFKQIEAEGPGPRWEQTSNAYRLELPARIAQYLPRWMKPAPLPDDDTHRRQAVVEETRVMVEALPSSEFAKLIVGGELGKVLSRIGAHLDREREYQKDTQPLTKSYLNGSDGVGLDGQQHSA
ncbi:helix-turn-helix domain-containing protein [Sphingomonas xinjiangensis]|uniref:DNA-binding transcriptional ArsR family regulator n=1 Tax=Sphingomonas xinjiangensis TaxID=643568 RepID=A0A840YHI7_9SPHN|nr:helix-turn-helix domain-containing protein [Sphingomonas xinjiangensis]MBB5712364.1 DNA-binding transcriptional ArsR family regulator [Sphingomonas xinjiangensis]